MTHQLATQVGYAISLSKVQEDSTFSTTCAPSLFTMRSPADDTSDYAPGYYDDKGEGGHKRVASQKESKQVPDDV